MSWRDAPLYIETHDLAVWLVAHTTAWQERAATYLAPRVAASACDLVEAIALALTFPSSRSVHLERADRSIVVLRTDLRLAEALDVLPARGLRHACDRLRTIGRMVGGWRKRVDAQRGKGWSKVSGDGPPAAGSG